MEITLFCDIYLLPVYFWSNLNDNHENLKPENIFQEYVVKVPWERALKIKNSSTRFLDENWKSDENKKIIFLQTSTRSRDTVSLPYSVIKNNTT